MTSNEETERMYAAEYAELEQAVKEGDNASKTLVAWYKLSGNGGVEYDAKGAVKLLEERVKDGDDRAMWMLAICYEYGMGCEQDLERAKELASESAKAGNEVGDILEFQCDGKEKKIIRRSSLSKQLIVKYLFLNYHEQKENMIT